MIRLADAVVLAYTKLRTHRVRTGLTVGIAGILFGLILGCIFIVQGIFDSSAQFSNEGLNDRAILSVSRLDNSFNIYQQIEDANFIADVEARHAANVAQKIVIAKKYSIPYNAQFDDHSPVRVNKETKKKYIDYEDVSSAAVQEVAREYGKKAYKPFDIKGYLAPYSSAHILPNNGRVEPSDGASFVYMKGGSEAAALDSRQLQMQQKDPDEADPILAIMNQSVTESFINKSVAFDPAKGELPAIIPFDQAEKLLGLKKLPKDADTQKRYDRLKEVRGRISEVTASFCYRNVASQQLLHEAVSQSSEFKKNGKEKTYVAPSVQYKPVSAVDCSAIQVEKDTRTAAEKKQADKYIAYQKEMGEYPGEPVQYKVTVRAVGISKSTPGTESVAEVSGFVEGLLGSWLGYGEWAIPAAMLKEVPESYRPSELFNISEDQSLQRLGSSGMAFETYLVEFDSVDEARSAMKRSEIGSYDAGEISSYPFGSNVLLVEEAKDLFAKAVLWSLLVVGGIAVIILGAMIGRTVSEGRRESAVFRAIGARRSDIGGIYGVYATLLSVRVAIFAAVLGAMLAAVAEVLLSDAATLSARYAYVTVNTTAEFHFFSIGSWYVPAILGAIIVVGLLASIIPIIRSARRNPIKDMRDDT